MSNTAVIQVTHMQYVTVRMKVCVLDVTCAVLLVIELSLQLYQTLYLQFCALLVLLLWCPFTVDLQHRGVHLAVENVDKQILFGGRFFHIPRSCDQQISSVLLRLDVVESNRLLEEQILFGGRFFHIPKSCDREGGGKCKHKSAGAIKIKRNKRAYICMYPHSVRRYAKVVSALVAPPSYVPIKGSTQLSSVISNNHCHGCSEE